jgi:hypothetical protein
MGLVDTNSHRQGQYSDGPTTLEPLKSIPATQGLLGDISRHTVLRLLDAGELVRVRVAGRTLVDPASIRDYITRHREDAAP